MESKSVVLGAVLVGLVFGAAATAALIGADLSAPTTPTEQDVDGPTGNTTTPNSSTADPASSASTDSLPTFEDSADFVAYVDSGRSQTSYTAGATAGGGDAASTVEPARERTATAVEAETATRRQGTAASESGAAGGDGGDGDASDRRVGTTNVQVTGVDEPDIVKTDGQRFYYAPRGRTSPPPGQARPEPVDDRRTDAVQTDGIRPERPPGRTHVLDTSSPADPAAVAAINASGTLLQVDDSLVMLGHSEIRGYNVSDPDSPERSWSRSLNGSLVTARVTGGQLYLVTESPARVGEPCPVEPVGGVEVSCGDVHHPREQIPVDATYTVLAVDPASGDLINATSFVGTTENTVIHMAGDALYVTYTKSAGRADATLAFLTEESELVPDSVRERLLEIDSYDISQRSKLREMSATIERWRQSLPEDRRREVGEQLEERFRTYVSENKRQFTTTGIVRVGVGGNGSVGSDDGDVLAVEAVGEVPGRPLNQFSMSQHNGTLRIATTIPRTSGAESENDLYVLDATSLDRIGAETGMGETERVYAVRYAGDTAYVVTFRRVDPFHVVDLSDPGDPEEVGKLKLPGFSSYLHPVDDSHVLGIGEEDGEVKAVLFDVSDPSDPTIDDTLLLDQSWSAIAETHHAFMQDERHGVFFLPAGREGLVVDYTGGSLDVEKRIRTDETPARARYVGDFLYVFAGETVEVLDETTWEAVTGLSL